MSSCRRTIRRRRDRILYGKIGAKRRMHLAQRDELRRERAAAAAKRRAKIKTSFENFIETAKTNIFTRIWSKIKAFFSKIIRKEKVAYEREAV